MMLCLTPLSWLAIPLFCPSLARVSIVPYVVILLVSLWQHGKELVSKSYQVFVNHTLETLIISLMLFCWMRVWDYLDHVVHNVARAEQHLMRRQPIQKWMGIVHSVGVTKSGDMEKDPIIGKQQSDSWAHIFLQRIWVFLYGGAQLYSLIAFIGFTTCHTTVEYTIVAGFVYAVWSVGVSCFLLYDKVGRFFDLFLAKPFFIGDLVTCGSVSGFVEAISLSYIVIRNFDAKQVFIPMSVIAGAVVENWSRRPTKPILLKVAIEGECDPAAVDEFVKFARSWIDSCPEVLQAGYKKCNVVKITNGYDLLIIFSPSIGANKNKLREKFILELMRKAKAGGVKLVLSPMLSIRDVTSTT
eukprot:TRINITY_DN80937_c0_g1_i1.p1 TRINITY_DN80937_c0_g1~~TRINITY_DN80937_c0_g1_i1.p1  ORF type:complete len:356 (-),score=27.04 TRINITY_DN80937_c0_g1_i1:40-1107(-)